jgi:predicted transposase YbfD/YdcC
MDSTTEGVVLPDGAAAAAPCGEQVQDLYAVLCSVTDGRRRRGRRYEAAVVLTVMLLAKMAGVHELSAIAHWVRLRLAWLQSLLPLPQGPCANTYRYVCEHIDCRELNAKLAAFFAQAQPQASSSKAPAPAPVRHLACDGKELRGTHRYQGEEVQNAQALLGVYDVASGVMHAIEPIAGKGHEPAAVLRWLEQANLSNTVLSLDALHTQTELCQTIRRRQGHYLLVVKANQPTLLEDIATFFAAPPHPLSPEGVAQSVDTRHGRCAVRRLRTSTALNELLADRWQDVAQVFQIVRTVSRRSVTRTETAYGITSLPPAVAPPHRLLCLVRDHWRIENCSHWRRDATLREDSVKLASKPAALVIAVLNSAITALLDRLGVRNLRAAMRTFAAYPEQALALLRSPS